MTRLAYGQNRHVCIRDLLIGKRDQLATETTYKRVASLLMIRRDYI